MEEHLAVAYVDPCGVYGSRFRRLSTSELRAEAWRRFDRQWDLHLTPDLLSAIMPLPAVARLSAVAR